MARHEDCTITLHNRSIMGRVLLGFEGSGIVLVGKIGRPRVKLEGLAEAPLEGLETGCMHWCILRPPVRRCVLKHPRGRTAGTDLSEAEGLLLSSNIGQWGLGEKVLWPIGP